MLCEVRRGFPQSRQENAGMLCRLGFFPNILKLIIH
jgi:hypothetical protein